MGMEMKDLCTMHSRSLVNGTTNVLPSAHSDLGVLYTTKVGEMVNVSEAYTVELEAVDADATWHSACGVSGTPASETVLSAMAHQQPDLANMTLLGPSGVMNASHLVGGVMGNQTTLFYRLPVLADFYSTPVDVTFTMAGDAFAFDSSTFVRIVAPETISLSIPASAMRNNPSAIPDVTSFVILAARGPRL